MSGNQFRNLGRFAYLQSMQCTTRTLPTINNTNVHAYMHVNIGIWRVG